MRVWHCPGHGGANRGLVHEGLVERDWVLGIARGIADQAHHSTEHRLARVADRRISYAARAAVAADWGADIVLCHHVNAMFKERLGTSEDLDLAPEPDTSADGMLVFAAPDDPVGIDVAAAIMRARPFDLRTKRDLPLVTSPDSWTRDAHAVLNAYRVQEIPAVLIEWGFATSPRDRATLTDPRHRPALIAAAIAGIARAIEVTRGV